jgi:hypothetical protein
MSAQATLCSLSLPPVTAAPSERSIEFLSAAEFDARALSVPDSFSLRFPRHWRSTPLRNPEAARLERDTLSWLRGYDIGIDPAEAEKLRKFDCAGYGGYSLPQADYETALLVTQFISLWLFWDDLQVEEELSWDASAVVQALTEPTAPRTSSRYVAAWADLGRRLQRCQSAAWLKELSVTMQQWLDNAKFETRMARAFQRGRCPDVSTAFSCRTISIGMYPTFHLIEYTQRSELPRSFHQHPAAIELKRLASRLVGMGNDLGGLAKDLRHRWLNLVVVLEEREGLDLATAFQRLVDLHNADVLGFDRVAATLPSWGPQADARIRSWVDAVRHNVHGFTLWESLAERYQDRKAVLGALPLVAPVSTFPGCAAEE